MRTHTTAARLCAALFLTSLAASTALADAPDGEALSETQTSYIGARLLTGDEEVTIGGIGPGVHDDFDDRDRYMFWEGNSLFAGVIDDVTGNRVDFVAEFYWFESSILRDSDFYVVVLKVNSSPSPDSDWRVATDESFIDEHVLRRDIGPVQYVAAAVDRSGEHGAIRWDWSVPFQNYRWEPSRSIEVEQSYAAGANVEGGAMKSVTEGVKIQAKGFMNASHKVRSRYTITLWRWEMRVLAGATDMEWDLTALDPEHSRDPAYHEYFLVLQSDRDVPVHINRLDFASTLREQIFLLPDHFMKLSARMEDVELHPPAITVDCDEGFHAVDDRCVSNCAEGFEWDKGVCTSVCADDHRFVRGQCELSCGEGMRAYRDRCVADCPEGFRPDGDKCAVACAEGYEERDGDCIRSCPRGTHPEGNRCAADSGEVICGDGTHLEGDRCVPDSGDPVGPGTAGCSNHLECPLGTHCDAGRCIYACLASADCDEGYLCNERAMCLVDPNAGQEPVLLPAEGGGCSTAALGHAGQGLRLLWGLIPGTRR